MSHAKKFTADFHSRCLSKKSPTETIERNQQNDWYSISPLDVHIVPITSYSHRSVCFG